MVYGFFQAVVSAWESPKTRQNSPAGGQDQTRDVQGVPVSRPIVLQPQERARGGDGREDEVDEQGPAPRDVGGQNATEEEADGAARPGDAAVDAEGLAPLGRIGERGGEEGQHRRGEECPERALNAAGGDKHREADRGATQG